MIFKSSDGFSYGSKGNFDESIVDQLNECCEDDAIYIRWIANLDIDRKWKTFLKKLMETTVEVGKKLGDFALKLGKILLNILKKLIEDFPSIAAGMLVGFFFGVIVSSVPLVGNLIGPLVTPLFVAFGGIVGYLKESNITYEDLLRAAIGGAMGWMMAL